MSAGHRFGRAVVALRWPIVILWISAAALATQFLPSIEESQNGALGDLVPNDAEAIDAELRSAELFGFPSLSRTIVVQRDGGGLDAAAQASAVTRATALNRGTVPGLERIGGAIPVLNSVSIRRSRASAAPRPSRICSSAPTSAPGSAWRSAGASPSAPGRGRRAPSPA
jgi:hypothetical protein